MCPFCSGVFFQSRAACQETMDSLNSLELYCEPLSVLILSFAALRQAAAKADAFFPCRELLAGRCAWRRPQAFGSMILMHTVNQACAQDSQQRQDFAHHPSKRYIEC